MSWSGAPWWKAHERSDWYQTGNSLGTWGGSLVWTRFSLRKMGSSSAYVIGIGSNCILGACCRGCCWCWRSGPCWNCDWFCEATSETTRVLSLSNSAWSVVTSSWMLVDFFIQTDMFSLFVCTSVVGASWLWTRRVRPVLRRVDLLWKRKIRETRNWHYEMQNEAWCLCKNRHIFLLKDLSK